MTVPKSTFGLLGLAVAALAAGYMLVPAPGATALQQPAPKAVTASAPAAVVASASTPVAASTPAPVAKPAPAAATNRPPVPLVTRGHANYFPSPTIEGTVAAKSASGKPTVDTGTSSASSLSPEAQQVPPTDGAQQALLAEPKTGNDSKAKAAIELDGYKNVRGLVQDTDGVWRGRAMRGRTEIAIRVNKDGSVSAD